MINEYWLSTQRECWDGLRLSFDCSIFQIIINLLQNIYFKKRYLDGSALNHKCMTKNHATNDELRHTKDLSNTSIKVSVEALFCHR